MLPTLEEIAMQIAIMHEKEPKLSISDIAGKLMLSPIFVINALDVGEDLGLISRLKDNKGEVTDELAVLDKIDYHELSPTALGSENYRIQTELILLISSANADKNDIEEGTLNYWTRGIKPSEIELAIHVLLERGILANYKLKDPKDKKSEYTFYTLNGNESSQWGTKQFKKGKK